MDLSRESQTSTNTSEFEHQFEEVRNDTKSESLSKVQGRESLIFQIFVSFSIDFPNIYNDHFIAHRCYWFISSPGHTPTFAKWRPRRETREKFTSRLFAAPRNVFSPYYFESCDFRQWEIRGVKKKCRPMKVCAFLGGKTIEHESFSAQINAGQGAKHLKKEGEFQFSDPWKNFFFDFYVEFACCWWSVWCSA